MRKVFLDTSAFVALRNRSEREHSRARKAFQHLVQDRPQLFTSNFVVSETYTTLLMRVGRTEAVGFGRAMRAGRGIEVIRIDEGIEENAWAILERHQDKTWSYVDATSFALMEHEGASEAFTFDHDFVQRGLIVIP